MRGIVRAAFAAADNRSHVAALGRPDDQLVADVPRPRRAVPAPARPRGRPPLARAAPGPTMLARVKERLAERYAAEVDLRTRLDLPAPPSGRPKRPRPRRGRRRSAAGASPTIPTSSLEWAWDVNAELDPAALAAGSHERVAWRCLLEPAHVWETRVADRTYHDSGCPFHMGIRVHPAESLAAFYPWLAAEWHPDRERAAARPGHASLGARDRLALPGRRTSGRPRCTSGPCRDRAAPTAIAPKPPPARRPARPAGARGSRRDRAGEDHRAAAAGRRRRTRLRRDASRDTYSQPDQTGGGAHPCVI